MVKTKKHAALEVLVLTITLVMGLLTIWAPASAWAADTPKQTVTKMSLGSAYRDSLSDSGESKWYSFTLSSAGRMRVSFGKSYVSGGYYEWGITVYTSNRSHRLVSFDADTESSETITRTLGLRAGTYYIEVGSNYRAYMGGVYSLTTSFTPSSNWEEEVNDSPQQAKRMAFAQTYNGVTSDIDSSYDDDWYVFDVPSAGHVKVEFGKEYNQSGRGWNFQLYNHDQSTELFSERPDTSTSETLVRDLGLTAGRYYLKVSENSSSDQDRLYALRISFTASSNWEDEINDAPQQAKAIELNGTYEGAVSRWDDQDWYRFTISKRTPIKLIVGHDYQIESHSWEVELYNADQSSRLLRLTAYTDSSQSESEEVDLNSGTYYVKVDYGSSSVEAGIYALKVGTLKYLPDISSVKLSQTTFTYDGTEHEPSITIDLKDGSHTLVEGRDYSYVVNYDDNYWPGKGRAIILIQGSGIYTGTKSKTVEFKIRGAKQTITIGPRILIFRCSTYGDSKKLKHDVRSYLYASAPNSVSFKKKSGNHKIKVSSNGMLVLKRGLKKGSYRLRVKITAAEDGNYRSASKVVTYKIKVKK